MNFISSYCQISESICAANGTVLLKKENGNAWSRMLYDYLKLDYPKFHKMDLMSKIGVIGVEILKSQNENIAGYADDEIALVFANKNASARTDMRFQHSFQEKGAPGPSLFVYTLPNILIGEISIRNKWFGENIFTVAEQFDPWFFENYCDILMPQKAAACLCGWVNVVDQQIDAFLFTVEKEGKAGLNLPLTSNNLLNLRKA